MKNKDWPNFNNNLITKVVNVIKSGKINYTSVYMVKNLKRNFQILLKKYSIALCNGTAALEVAIKSLNFPRKSRIVVPARSFFSSASCIVNTGHIPVFVDIDPITQNISIEDLKINNNIKAIICVHLGGLPCDMKNIKNLAKTRNIKIIEDCSQAHGASINNKQVGSFGEIATWSFCTDKIISTLGEGGMISTNNKKFTNIVKDISIMVLLYLKKPEKFIYNKDIFGTNQEDRNPICSRH